MKVKKINRTELGLTGTYSKGRNFLRVTEYIPGRFHIERGRGNTITSTSVEHEGGARFDVSVATLIDGFRQIKTD